MFTINVSYMLIAIHIKKIANLDIPCNNASRLMVDKIINRDCCYFAIYTFSFFNSRLFGFYDFIGCKTTVMQREKRCLMGNKCLFMSSNLVVEDQRYKRNFDGSTVEASLQYFHSLGTCGICGIHNLFLNFYLRALVYFWCGYLKWFFSCEHCFARE